MSLLSRIEGDSNGGDDHSPLPLKEEKDSSASYFDWFGFGGRRRRSECGDDVPSKRPALDRAVDAPTDLGAGEGSTNSYRFSWLAEDKITPQDEEREWASVTPEEILQIESDLRGLSFADVSPASSRCPPGGELDGIEGGSVGGGVSPPLKREGGGGTHLAQHFTEEEKEGALLPSMEAEIDALPVLEKAAYLEARRKCPEQVGDAQKKAFLWKENFNAKLAAKRLALHWQYKLQLFGPQKCFLPMSLCDAVLDDLVAISSGFVRVLPVRDEHRRLILLFTLREHDRWTNAYSRDSMVRACWYLFHVATQDPEMRRRGAVCLVDISRSNVMNNFDPTLYRIMMNLNLKCNTGVLRSIHIFNPGPVFHLVMPIMKAIFGERMRKRLVIHYGSTENVLQSITKFGLNKDCLPCELGGNIQEFDPIKWVSKQMVQEGLDNIKCSPRPSQDIQVGLKRSLDPENFNSIVLSQHEQPGYNTEKRTSSDARISPAPCNVPRSAYGSAPSKKKLGDPRMDRAIEVKLVNPDLPLLDALIRGGFVFPAVRHKGQTDRMIKDSDGMTLFQRKNQLCRRLRKIKKKASGESNSRSPLQAGDMLLSEMFC